MLQIVISKFQISPLVLLISVFINAIAYYYYFRVIELDFLRSLSSCELRLYDISIPNIDNSLTSRGKSELVGDLYSYISWIYLTWDQFHQRFTSA